MTEAWVQIVCFHLILTPYWWNTEQVGAWRWLYRSFPDDKKVTKIDWMHMCRLAAATTTSFQKSTVDALKEPNIEK